MSILTKLPKHIQDSILSKDPKLRLDLLMISSLERKGWEVSFPDDIIDWRHSATFSKDPYTVYRYKGNWVCSEMTDKGIQKKTFDFLEDAVDFAEKVC
jgi:hypothetical protein